MRQYFHDLRLESELSDLRSGNAHTDSVGILPGEEMVYAGIATSVISTNIPPSGNTVDRPVILLASHTSARWHYVLCFVSRSARGAICTRLTCASTDSLAFDYVASGSNRSLQAQDLIFYKQKEVNHKGDLFLLVEHQGLEPWTDRL